MSDSSGWIHVPGGIDRAMLAEIMDLKNNRRGRISEMADDGASYTPANPSPRSTACGASTWTWRCLAPRKTSSTVRKPRCWSRTASSPWPRAPTPCTPKRDRLQARGALRTRQGQQRRCVATSGLEMSQNSPACRGPAEVDERLEKKTTIHENAPPPPRNTAAKATTCSVRTWPASAVADAMVAQGMV